LLRLRPLRRRRRRVGRHGWRCLRLEVERTDRTVRVVLRPGLPRRFVRRQVMM
jgi:hypothetical protein